MNEVRNLDGRLVCRVFDDSNTVEIKCKDCITLIKMNPNGIIEIMNMKNSAA